MTDHYAIAQELVDGATGPSGGASIWQTDERFTGYLVGIPGQGLQVPEADQIAHDYDAVVARVAAWVAESGEVDDAATWGSWVDTDTRIVYFDVSSHFHSETLALAAGRARGELAIWHLDTGDEVTLN